MSEEKDRKTVDYVRTRKETCQILGISRSTLRRWEQRGEAPPRVRLTNKLSGYLDSTLKIFIASRTVI